MKNLTLRIFFALFIFSPFQALAEMRAPDAIANFVDLKGNSLGNANLYQGEDGVLIRFDLKGLKPGFHGLHFHEVGDCSDYTEGFLKSKSHLHTENREHGLLSTQGPHAGDLTNIYADQSGKAVADAYTELVSLQGKDFKTELLDEDGSAIIIHENADDYTTQPSGNAGKRVACAVIKLVDDAAVQQ